MWEYNSIEIHWEKLESYNYTSLEKTMVKKYDGDINLPIW